LQNSGVASLGGQVGWVTAALVVLVWRDAMVTARL
jgi:hypothetical protein